MPRWDDGDPLLFHHAQGCDRDSLLFYHAQGRDRDSLLFYHAQGCKTCGFTPLSGCAV